MLVDAFFKSRRSHTGTLVDALSESQRSHTGLRGFLSAYILLFHCLHYSEYGVDIVGSAMVSFFFLLSGFALTLQYLPGAMSRRAERAFSSEMSGNSLRSGKSSTSTSDGASDGKSDAESPRAGWEALLMIVLDEDLLPPTTNKYKSVSNMIGEQSATDKSGAFLPEDSVSSPTPTFLSPDEDLIEDEDFDRSRSIAAHAAPTQQLRQPDQILRFGPFLQNRLARVLPVTNLAHALAIPSVSTPGLRRYTPGILPENLFPAILWNCVIPANTWVGGGPMYSLAGPAWTISTLMAFYVLFPKLIFPWVERKLACSKVKRLSW